MQIKTIMKIVIKYYGVFGVFQLINAERHYSYTLPRDELQPVKDKLAKFSKCNSQSSLDANNYEFFFTTDHPSSSCSPYKLLQREFFIHLLHNAINDTFDINSLEQGETNHLVVKIIRDTNTSLLPAQNGEGTEFPNNNGAISEASTEISTTLDPLLEQQMREKRERNNLTASIITGVLVALLIGSIIGCACAQYAKTVKQSGTYVVNNP